MSNTLPSRTAGQKLTKKEKGQVLEIIVSCLLRHTKPSQIKSSLVKYNLSDRSISTYTRKAYEMIANRPLETVERAKRIVLSELEEEYRRAEHSRDRIDILKYKAKLLGLDDTNINVTHKYDDISDDTLVEIVQGE